ncbi:hypothetical protein TNCV_4549301 [Trichonephila clavipes]|nr:hypothetical protein TNCV_4549301 [Trichonephila clavipes]
MLSDPDSTVYPKTSGAIHAENSLVMHAENSISNEGSHAGEKEHYFNVTTHFRCFLLHLHQLFVLFNVTYEAKERQPAKCSNLQNFSESVSVSWAREVANHQLPWLHFEGVNAIFVDKLLERNSSSPPTPSHSEYFRFPKDSRHSISKNFILATSNPSLLASLPPTLTVGLLRVEKEMIPFLWSHFHRIL